MDEGEGKLEGNFQIRRENGEEGKIGRKKMERKETDERWRGTSRFYLYGMEMGTYIRGVHMYHTEDVIPDRDNIIIGYMLHLKNLKIWMDWYINC